MVKVTQSAFNAGIIAEGMYARNDTEKFQKGLRDAVNVVIRAQGGVENRAGTTGAARYDTSDGVSFQYLVPFAFNTEETYQLEFSAGVFRILRDGAYVLDTAVGGKALSAVTGAVAAKLTLTVGADAASFPTGTLAYIDDPNGTHKMHEAIVKITGAAGAELSFTVFDGSVLDTSGVGWGATGASAVLRKVYQQTHPYALADMPRVRFAQDADTMYLAHSGYVPQKLQRQDHDEWTLAAVDFTPDIAVIAATSVAITAVSQAAIAVVTANAHGLQPGDGVLIRNVGGMTQINGKSFIAGVVTTNTFQLKAPAGVDVNSTGYTAYTSGGTADTLAAGFRRGTDVVITDMLTYSYVVAAIMGENLEEGLPSAAFTVDNDLAYRGSENYLVWKAVPGASRYAVYRLSAGTYGFIGATTGTTFTDVNITPDIATGVRLGRIPFVGVGNYPSVVSFYEQRLAFGATILDPQLVEMSRVGSVENFSSAYPSLPDDAFRFRIRAAQVNEVRGFASADSFLILTSGGEWEIAAQGEGEYLRPDKRKLAPQSTFGSAAIEPLRTGTVVLYVEPSRTVIRDYIPGDSSAQPGDLTVLAADLFENRQIVSWAYAAAPGRVVWTVLDNGTLLSMTYMPEHDVWGWTRHVLAGENARARQVSVNREGNLDALYIVVTRVIGGVDVTTTERLSRREDTNVTLAYFVDGGFRATYGVAVNEITGLLHLRGQAVVALVDGDVVRGLTVDATGAVNMGDKSGLQISVGLPYESLMRTLDVQMDLRGIGSSDGGYKATSEVALKLKRSRGVAVGTSLDRMSALKEWNATLVGGPIPLRTYTPIITVGGDWVRDATLFIRQREPLPMGVLSITPVWEFGG